MSGDIRPLFIVCVLAFAGLSRAHAATAAPVPGFRRNPLKQKEKRA
jgi:hypothetical protein